MPFTDKWSCDERDRKQCQNPHGCHCREIAHLIASRDELTAERDRVARNRDMWKGQCERQATRLRDVTDDTLSVPTSSLEAAQMRGAKRRKQLTAYQRPEGS